MRMMKLKDLLLNLCVAADVGCIGIFSLAPFWWEYPPLWVLGRYILFVMAFSAIITVIQWGWRKCFHGLGKRRIEIKYDLRGRNPDGVRLGYISSETICEIARKGRRE